MKNFNLYLAFLVAAIVAAPAQALTHKIGEDILKLGPASSSDRVIEFNVGSGTANPKIKYSVTDSLLEFSNDGTNYKSFGSGSGSGGAGYTELLANGDFESGTTDWTASGGTFANATSGSNLLNGLKSGLFTPSAGAQTLTSGQKTIPNGLFNAPCVGSIYYKTSETSNPYILNVIDGSSNVLATYTLPAASIKTRANAPFLCPSSGTVALQIKAAASTPSNPIAADDAHLGNQDLLANVSQASMYGSALWPGTGSCFWNGTSTSYGNFSVDSDCTFPSGSGLTGNAVAPATKIPGISFNVLPPGDYYVVAQGTFIDNTADANGCYFRISDGTTASGASVVSADGAKGALSQLSGRFSYTTAQGSTTFQVQYASDNATNTCGVTTGAGTRAYDLEFKVYRFPTTVDTALNSNLPSWPTVQVLTSSSGTYIRPAGVKYIEVEMVGGGGGGSGSGANSGATATGGTGGDTTFGVITAHGGVGGLWNSVHSSGSTASLGSGPFGIALNGAIGSGASGYTSSATSFVSGGAGAGTRFGGGGGGGLGGGPNSVLATVGVDAQANTGAGGGGGGMSAGQTTGVGGTGGDAGAYVYATITAPSSSYSYGVGAGGSGGPARTGGMNGGAGGSGLIIVREFYGTQNAPMLIGSVVSNTPSSERVERAYVGGSSGNVCSTSPCPVLNQSGSWVTSVTRTGTGAYTVNVASGIFSGTPMCTISNAGAVGTSITKIVPQSASAISVQSLNTSGTNIDTDYNLICMGPR